MVNEPYRCCFAATIIPTGKRSFLRCKPVDAEASFIAAALQPRPAGPPGKGKASNLSPGKRVEAQRVPQAQSRPREPKVKAA